MAQFYATEAPGGLGDAYQCPYCSMMYLVARKDENGQTVPTPRVCSRCGSPMDVEKAQEFQDAQTLTAAPSAPPRRVVRV